MVPFGEEFSQTLHRAIFINFLHLKFFASSTNFIKGIINIGVCEYIDNSSIKITVEDEKYVATLYVKQDGEYIPILLTTGTSS